MHRSESRPRSLIVDPMRITTLLLVVLATGCGKKDETSKQSAPPPVDKPATPPATRPQVHSPRSATAGNVVATPIGTINTSATRMAGPNTVRGHRPASDTDHNR